ncbi:MAG TPA: twin-arginine translocase TatA/TatE family subunit [Acidimicrobiales bacterium]|jgi:Sec-independent protein translocase protein TatA|nr:twin-arginine translocase TatA/TatE family subunit [Acidimicrobiales bacterium]
MLAGEIFGPDLLIVVIIGAVLLFGGAAIPKFARSLGQTKTEFENGMRSAKELSDTVKNPSSVSQVSEPDQSK